MEKQRGRRADKDSMFFLYMCLTDAEIDAFFDEQGIESYADRNLILRCYMNLMAYFREVGSWTDYESYVGLKTIFLEGHWHRHSLLDYGKVNHISVKQFLEQAKRGVFDEK